MNIIFKRGTKKAVDNYVGENGEIAIDLDSKSLRIFDGVTKGGSEIPNASEVVAKIEQAIEDLNESISKKIENIDISGGNTSITVEDTLPENLENGHGAIVPSEDKLNKLATLNATNVGIMTLAGSQIVTGSKVFSAINVENLYAKQVRDFEFVVTGNEFNSANGMIQHKTVTENCELSFTMNLGETMAIYLKNGGNFAVKFPKNFLWNDGETPTLTEDGMDLLVVQRTQQGYYASVANNLKISS